MQADTATTIEHLDLLIDYIKTTYILISQNLLPLLACSEITYNLLLLLFKPNTLVYTKCFSTKKPQCVIYDSAEEKENRSKEKFFNIAC